MVNAYGTWSEGYKANIISTIVDVKKRGDNTRLGYKANIISTIVDRTNLSIISRYWL